MKRLLLQVLMTTLMLTLVGVVVEARANSGGAPADSADAAKAATPEGFTVTIEAPEDPLRIAERAKIKIEIERPADLKLKTDLETLKHRAGRILIEKISKASEKRDDDRVLDRFTLDVVVYYTGRFYIIDLPFIYEAPDGTTRRVFSGRASIKVVSVIEGDPAAAELRPIKGPFRVPQLTLMPLYIGGGVLCGILLLAIAFVGLRRLELTEPPPPPKPLLPPWTEALEALEALDPDQDELEALRVFYFSLSEILRRYLVRRYELHASELTSSELLDLLQQIEWPDRSIYILIEQGLLDADLVKFARFVPAQGQSARAVEDAVKIVDQTRPRATPVAAPLDAEGSETDASEARPGPGADGVEPSEPAADADDAWRPPPPSSASAVHSEWAPIADDAPMSFADEDDDESDDWADEEWVPPFERRSLKAAVDESGVGAPPPVVSDAEWMPSAPTHGDPQVNTIAVDEADTIAEVGAVDQVDDTIAVDQVDDIAEVGAVDEGDVDSVGAEMADDAVEMADDAVEMAVDAETAKTRTEQGGGESR